jgi:hypothetical protein
VGVLLWETLTDRHPFWGVPIQEVARAIQEGAPPLASERRGLPRRLVGAVDASLALDPAARPSAADLSAELRNALRTPEGRPGRTKRAVEASDESVAPARRHARRVAPVALGAVTALLAATMLPFWPPVLVAAIVVAAAAASWLDPRLGLAVALGAAVFPIGNVAEGAAILYGVFAVGWLLLNWRDGRHGLLFVSGPLLAAVGLLPVVPLVVQRARGGARRAAHGAAAVLSAALLAAVGGDTVPIAQEASGSLGIEPLTPVPDVSIGVWEWLLGHPATTTAALLVAAASALLPWARRASRHGVAAIGFVLVAASVLAGAGIASTLVCLAAWAIAGFAATAFRRVS